MNIEETRRRKAARCRVDLRQMFDKGLCRLKFDSYALYRDDDADSLLIRDGELLEFGGWKTTESGTRIHSWHIRKRKADLSYGK